MAVASNHGEGLRLFKLLRSVLGLPESCKWFELRMGADEAITLKAEYYPDVDMANLGETPKFDLVPRKPGPGAGRISVEHLL